MSVQQIERGWRIFSDAEPHIKTAESRYVFFCGAFAAFYALARVKFSAQRLQQIHAEMQAFQKSVFDE
jgi:hypothetical protein